MDTSLQLKEFATRKTVTKIDEQLLASKQSTLLDLDSVLASMGLSDATPPPSVERILSGDESTPMIVVEAPAESSAEDPFGWLEHELRVFNTPTDRPREDPAIEELEAWLRALDALRMQSGSA